MIAIEAKSVTIVGAAGWFGDALVTAVMVADSDTARRAGEVQLSGYQLWPIDRHENNPWSI